MTLVLSGQHQTRKAVGPDGLHGWVLKNGPDELKVASTYKVPYHPTRRITWISLPEMQLPPSDCFTAFWEKTTVDLWEKIKLANSLHPRMFSLLNK